MSEFLMERGPLLLATGIVIAVFGRMGFGLFRVIQQHRRQEKALADWYEAERRAGRVDMGWCGNPRDYS